MADKKKANKVLKSDVEKEKEVEKFLAEKEVEAPKAEKVKSVSIGDTVHIVQANGFHSSALVTKVNEDGTINLFVTRDDDVKDHYYLEFSAYSKEATPGTWHWPEKEEKA